MTGTFGREFLLVSGSFRDGVQPSEYAKRTLQREERERRNAERRAAEQKLLAKALSRKIGTAPSSRATSACGSDGGRVLGSYEKQEGSRLGTAFSSASAQDRSDGVKEHAGEALGKQNRPPSRASQKSRASSRLGMPRQVEVPDEAAYRRTTGDPGAGNSGTQIGLAREQESVLRAQLRFPVKGAGPTLPKTAHSVSAAASRLSTAASRRPRSGIMVQRAGGEGAAMEGAAMIPPRRPSSQLSSLSSALNARPQDLEISDSAAQSFCAKYGVSPEAFATRYALDRLRVQSASGVHAGALRVAEKAMLGVKHYDKINEFWLCDGGVIYAFGERGREAPSLIASRLLGQEQRIQFDMITQAPRTQDGELLLRPQPTVHGGEELQQLREELQNQTRKTRFGASTAPRDD